MVYLHLGFWYCELFVVTTIKVLTAIICLFCCRVVELTKETHRLKLLCSRDPEDDDILDPHRVDAVDDLNTEHGSSLKGRGIASRAHGGFLRAANFI